MTTDEIGALEPNARRRLQQFADCFKKAPVFNYFVNYSLGLLAHFDRNQLVIAENLERASENLNRLIELITHQPSQLIFSRPPTARKVKP